MIDKFDIVEIASGVLTYPQPEGHDFLLAVSFGMERKHLSTHFGMGKVMNRPQARGLYMKNFLFDLRAGGSPSKRKDEAIPSGKHRYALHASSADGKILTNSGHFVRAGCAAQFSTISLPPHR